MPNADLAEIDPEELRSYVLSAGHPVGRFKAGFFSALGLTVQRCQEFEEVRRIQHLTIRHDLSWRREVTVHPLDFVVLNRDLPTHGVKRGDLGAVVDVYAPDAIEVEFVTASGRTQALVTLRCDDVRDIGDDDLVAVRSPGLPTTAHGG